MDRIKFFVVGYPRSGTTLLASILARNEQLCVPPETHFFPHIVDRYCTGGGQQFKKLFSTSKRLADLGVEWEEIEQMLAADAVSISCRDVFCALLELYADHKKAAFVGEKTPRHLFYVPKIIEWFPDAKIICLLRDPRDAVDSLVKVGWTHNNIYRHAAHWQYCTALAMTYTKRYPNNFRIYKMEDVVLSPEKILMDICDWIQIKFSKSMLKPRDTGVVPEWERAWKQGADMALDIGRIQQWKKSAEQFKYRVIESLCRKEMLHFGYSIEDGYKKPFLIKIIQMIYSPSVYSMWFFFFL